jgi:hypothetical protein
MLSSAKHLAEPLRLRSGQAWPGWLGWAQILRCPQDDKVRGRAFAKPVLSPEPVEGSKDLVRQPRRFLTETYMARTINSV